MKSLLEVLVDEGERARALRQCTPFAGFIDPRTRWRIWQKDQQTIDGARMLIEALLKRQHPDGSWTNTFTDGREDDPLVATPMAAEALLLCMQVMLSPAPPSTKPTTHPTTNPTAAILKSPPSVVSSFHAIGHAAAFGVADPAGHGCAVATAGGEVAAGPARGGTLMTRDHRRWHLWLWLLLGPLVAAGLVTALLVRPG